MGITLSDYLATRRAKDFRRQPAYSKTGDYLIYLQEDVPYFAERIDEVITVYRESGSRRLIGCKIKGIADILQTCGSFQVEVHGGQLTLGFLFKIATAVAEPDEAVGRYDELRPLWDVPVDCPELIPA